VVAKPDAGASPDAGATDAGPKPAPAAPPTADLDVEKD
jgi:hypothetical protein